ncbi:MAG: uracil-DNA glycosylase [Sphingobacteriaceae bacterium]|nr:uracil-DNA glycosylase [Sphingobacteriaceae bacterium]
MQSLSQRLPSDWRLALAPALSAPSFIQLQQRLAAAYAAGESIYPEANQLFKAFELCALDKVKVVILGQDPYHGPGQAHGLSFSVPDGLPFPPSLRNIFKELESDLGIPAPNSGNLERWAAQGVLLLNSILSVQAQAAGSHRSWGWEPFTDAVLAAVSKQQNRVVFLLWGNFAIQKAGIIDSNKHLVLTAPHPSPLSAYKGWWGSKPFSQTNKWLINQGQSAILW